MLASVPSRLIAEWQAYYQLEPFGETRGDLRNAMLCALVANKLRGKDEPAYGLDDFTPRFGEQGKRSKRTRRERQQTPEEQMAIMMGMFGGPKRDG